MPSPCPAPRGVARTGVAPGAAAVVRSGSGLPARDAGGAFATIADRSRPNRAGTGRGAARPPAAADRDRPLPRPRPRPPGGGRGRGDWRQCGPQPQPQQPRGQWHGDCRRGRRPGRPSLRTGGRGALATHPRGGAGVPSHGGRQRRCLSSPPRARPDVFWRWRPESLERRGRMRRQRGWGPGEPRACKRGFAGRAMWSHLRQHVSAGTVARVFLEQAAAGNRASHDKQGEFTLSSRFL